MILTGTELTNKQDFSNFTENLPITTVTMSFDYSKLPNKISGLFEALDSLGPSGRADGVLSDAEIANLDLGEMISPENMDILSSPNGLVGDLFKSDSRFRGNDILGIEKNLLETIDRLVHKPSPSQMPLAPGETLVQSGDYTYRPQGAVAIESGSRSAEWFVETSGAVAHPSGIEIPFGLVEVSEANAYVRGTVRYAKFDIVLESDAPMKTDGQGITQVLGNVTIQTPFGSFSAQSKGSFQVIVSEQNEAPLLMVQDQPIEVASIENPKNHFRIRQGGAALFDTTHYAFLAKSEWDLGDTLTGFPEEDISKTASRFQTEAQTGFSFGEWDSAHIRPEDRTVYRKDQNMIEYLGSNRIKLTANKELTAAFVNPANDSFLVHGDGRIVIRQIVIHDVPTKEENPQQIDWFSLAGDGQAPDTQADYGFSEVILNQEETSLGQFHTEQGEDITTVTNLRISRNNLLYDTAPISDPRWGYFIETDKAIRVKGLWIDEHHPLPLDGSTLIFGRSAEYDNHGNLDGGSLSLFKPKNDGRHFWIPSERVSPQKGKTFNLFEYRDGLAIENYRPIVEKKTFFEPPPENLFSYFTNDAVAKGDYTRANDLTKLSDDQELIKELVQFYEYSSGPVVWDLNTDNKHYCSNCEMLKQKRLFLVDLAIHYFQRFGKTIRSPGDLISLLKFSLTTTSSEGSLFLVYESPWEAIEAMTAMGLEIKQIVGALSQWGFSKEARTLFIAGDTALEVVVLDRERWRAQYLEKDEIKAKELLRKQVALQRKVLETAQKAGENTDYLKFHLRNSLLELEDYDEALRYSDEPYAIGEVYERKGDYSAALDVYEKGERFYEGVQVLRRMGRNEESLDWYLRDIEVNEGGRFEDNSLEARQKRISDRYQDAFEVADIPEDQREAARAKLCASAARKAEELGIDVSQLLPDCKTE